MTDPIKEKVTIEEALPDEKYGQTLTDLCYN